MSVQFFAPKTLGSAAIGAGALCGGGTIYWYQVPTTWRGLLVKEGYSFLSEEYDYKGMFEDQRNDEDWKKEVDLKEATDSDVNTKAKNYCASKLDAELPSSSAGDYASTKKKLVAFCTSGGIKTVKARLVQSKKSKLNWIPESNGEEKWKTVFAVYRYDDQFIEWLKQENVDDSSLSKDSKVDEYTKLQTACTNLLKKNYGDVSEKHIKYGSWWCVELPYTTIKDKIQKQDSNWSEKSQDDSDWNDLVTRWKDTEQVKKWANKASGESDENKDLSEVSLKKLCDSTNVASKLSENDSYQEKYIVIMSVCKSSSST